MNRSPVALLLLVACVETDECRQLSELLSSSNRALAAVRGRAALADRTGETLSRRKAEAENKIEREGLDLPEAELQKALEERVEALPGASLERTTRPVGVEQHGPALEEETETVFRITFPARGLEEAWARTRSLIAIPPTTRLLTLIGPKKAGEPWALDLGRPDIQRLPMNFQPKRPPARRSAADVPSSPWGFCGADALRKQIEGLEREIETLSEKAASTTVNLPLSASYQGLSRRADVVIESEAESRRLSELFVSAVLSGKQRFLGLGVEKEAVLLEVQGDAKARKAVQAGLPEEVLASLREIPGERPGVVRMALANAVAAGGRRPDAGGAEPPHRHEP